MNLGNHLFLGFRATVLSIDGGTFESPEHDGSIGGSPIEIEAAVYKLEIKWSSGIHVWLHGLIF